MSLLPDSLDSLSDSLDSLPDSLDSLPDSLESLSDSVDSLPDLLDSLPDSSLSEELQLEVWDNDELCERIESKGIPLFVMNSRNGLQMLDKNCARHN